jgi:hypothetical protein
MKRFALFCGEDYYPDGGWKDFRRTFDTVQEALAVSRSVYEWYHVVDLLTGKIVEEGEA